MKDIDKNIAIIGAGNMGMAIAERLIKTAVIRPRRLTLSGPAIHKAAMKRLKGVAATKDNERAAAGADIVMLCVKPQIFQSVAEEIRGSLRKGALVISIMAGVRLTVLRKYFGKTRFIVRAMPNLGAKYGASMTGWIATGSLNADQKKTVEALFASLGAQMRLKSEDDINKMTAITATGPAYFFYLAESLEKQAKEFGLGDARKMAEHVLKASALLSQETGADFGALRQSITSAKGTTAAAIGHLESRKAQSIFQAAVRKAYRRARGISKSIR